jgi:pimeloyl-ACP methyl ester carboxylesterase
MNVESMLNHQQITLGGVSIHVVEQGNIDAPPFLFLHGWPESWRSWSSIFELADHQSRVIAVDLPGIGASTASTNGSKRQLANVIHELVVATGLRRLTLIGHDVGGMVVYAYLHAFADIERAVIMDVVVPGLEPWEAVISNPRIWHFAMHAIPHLPETLVQGHQRPYFDYFFDGLSRHRERITPELRDAYVQAYRADSSLSAGFDWYRAFECDAEENMRASRGAPVDTPVLYLRGEHEPGDMESYLRGLRSGGLTRVQGEVIRDAGHFTAEESPEKVWKAIYRFARSS